LIRTLARSGSYKCITIFQTPALNYDVDDDDDDDDSNNKNTAQSTGSIAV
jgi:hypothetical protein